MLFLQENNKDIFIKMRLKNIKDQIFKTDFQLPF